MKITYANNTIERICLNPDVYAVKAGLPKNIIDKLKTFLYRVKRFQNCADFFKPAHQKYQLEKLINKKGLMSIRLDRKYRVTFYEIDKKEIFKFEEIVGIEIVDISNHYK